MSDEPQKLTSFNYAGQDRKITFVETIRVKEGVDCNVYAFADDDSQDLAIVKVARGHKTPLQKVLYGDKTVEGFLTGKGELSVRSIKGDTKVYKFEDDAVGDREILVQIGEIMQWTASNDVDLLFYEICEPPYKDGRYENLEE